MGTVELTGLEMMRMLASGLAEATALARSRTMEALVLKRSDIRRWMVSVGIVSYLGWSSSRKCRIMGEGQDLEE